MKANTTLTRCLATVTWTDSRLPARDSKTFDFQVAGLDLDDDTASLEKIDEEALKVWKSSVADFRDVSAPSVGAVYAFSEGEQVALRLP